MTSKNNNGNPFVRRGSTPTNQNQLASNFNNLEYDMKSGNSLKRPRVDSNLDSNPRIAPETPSSFGSIQNSILAGVDMRPLEQHFSNDFNRRAIPFSPLPCTTAKESSDRIQSNPGRAPYTADDQISSFYDHICRIQKSTHAIVQLLEDLNPESRSMLLDAPKSETSPGTGRSDTLSDLDLEALAGVLTAQGTALHRLAAHLSGPSRNTPTPFTSAQPDPNPNPSLNPNPSVNPYPCRASASPAPGVMGLPGRQQFLAAGGVPVPQLETHDQDGATARRLLTATPASRQGQQQQGQQHGQQREEERKEKKGVNSPSAIHLPSPSFGSLTGTGGERNGRRATPTSPLGQPLASCPPTAAPALCTFVSLEDLVSPATFEAVARRAPGTGGVSSGVWNSPWNNFTDICVERLWADPDSKFRAVKGADLDPGRSYRLEVDGGAQRLPSNLGTAAAAAGYICASAVILKDEETGETLARASFAFSGGTNNKAEWLAFIIALKWARKKGFRRVTVQGDSELVVKQLKGEYSADKMRIFYNEGRKLLDDLPGAKIQHVLRALNTDADRLCDETIEKFIKSRSWSS